MIQELCQATDLDDKERRTLEQKVSGMESRGFELQTGLQQRDAIIGLSAVLDKFVELYGADVLRAKTDMSRVKLPMGPALDSRIGRLQKGLSLETDEEMLEIIYMVARAYAKPAKRPRWIWLNRDSNIGYPYYNSSSPNRVEAFITGLGLYHTGGDLPKRAFGGIRKQPDSTEKDATGANVPKKRDFAYPSAMWTELAPLFLETSTLELKEDHGYVFGKTPVEVDSPFSGPARVRGVKGLSYIDNSFPMVLRQTVCDPGEINPWIWKHRGVSDVLLKVKGKAVFCTDFSNFDQTVMGDELDAIRRAFCDNWPDLAPAIDQMFDMLDHLTFTSADLIRPPLSQHRNVVYYRSIAEPGSNHGILSGLGITDVIGKIIGTAFGIWVQRRLGQKINSLEEAEGLILNCGDDLVIITDKPRDEEVLKIIDDQKFKKVRQEDEKKFLGCVFRDDDHGLVKAYYQSKLSFLVNSLCPERQAGTGMRPYPEFGLAERYANIIPHIESDKEAKLIHEFYSRFTALIPDFASLVEEQRDAAFQNADFQAFMDKYGLTKMEEVFYRLSVKDLPREDAALIGILVPSQEVVKAMPELLPHLSQ